MTHAWDRIRGQVLEAIRYVAVAGLVMLLYLSVFSGGVLLGIHYFVAILIAQVIAITVAFPLYRRFVFNARGRIIPDFLKFLSVWVTGAVAGVVVTPLLVEVLGFHPIPAQIVAVVVVGAASFVANKFFSFKSQEVGAPRAGSSERKGIRL